MTDSIRIDSVLRSRPKATSWNGQSFSHAEVKLDGRRVLVVRTSSDVAVLAKRYEDYWRDLRHRPKLSMLLKSLPHGTILDCELWTPGLAASQVPRALANPAIRLRITPFAAPFVGGDDLRGESIQTARAQIRSLGFDPPAEVNLPNDREFITAEATRQKIEGYVLKVLHWNSYGWWKVKPVRTADLRITGSLPGEGKYDGLVGSLTCETEDGVVVAQASGMSDADRHAMTAMANVGLLKGQVAEIAFDRIDAGGRLRFPRFIRWRTDKTAAVTFSELSFSE